MYKYLLFFFIVFSTVFAVKARENKDSVGVTKINGKFHIRYMVSPGETIYRISSKYKIPISDLIDTNPELEFGLKTGQIINIPFTFQETGASVTKNEEGKPSEALVNAKKTDTIINKEVVHTVQPGETFYSLSKKYNIPVDELLLMNKVEIKAGQKIIVSTKPKETVIPNNQISKNQVEVPKKTEPIEDFGSVNDETADYDNTKKHLLVIPFDPYLYFSDADDEISAASKIQRTKVRQAFRRRLSALLDPQGYETINLLGGKAKDSLIDLNKVYGSVTYSYQDILYSPYNKRIERQEDKGLGKEKETTKAVNEVSQTSRAAQAKDPEKYFGVKINNNQFYTYFNNKYKIDYYLFINQFEVKTNYEHCLDRATMNYERGFITHYSIFDKKGKQIAGNRIYLDYNSNTNNISKILADNMQKVADRIMNDLPSGK